MRSKESNSSSAGGSTSRTRSRRWREPASSASTTTRSRGASRRSEACRAVSRVSTRASRSPSSSITRTRPTRSRTSSQPHRAVRRPGGRAGGTAQGRSDGMIPLGLEEITALCPGALEKARWADEVTGVQIDSRRVEEGDLFVAVGTGADFVKHAFARGAAATLVPEDAFAALAALAGRVRDRSTARFVGITGSMGKTSTKDILAAICTPQRRTVAVDFTARHLGSNALTALTVAHVLGLEVPDRLHVEFSEWRNQELPLPGGGVIVNDAWNANPVSMRAALEHLVALAAGRRTVAVLGDMAELGDYSEEGHREVGRTADELGIDEVVAIGPQARAYGGRHVDTVEDAVALLDELLQPGDCVLVKGA